MAAPLTCPECAAVIRPASPTAGRKIRCPKCGASFRREQPEDDGVITAVLVADPVPVLEPVDHPRGRRRDDEPEVALPARSGNGGLLLALGLALGGVFLLLLACGGLGTLVWWRGRSNTQQPVAAAPVAAPPVVQEQQDDRPMKAVQPPADPPPVAPPPVAPPPPPPPVDPGPPPEPGSTSIPLAALRDLKAATVFIKVENALARASGSGFLIRADGGAGYVVTNHHVIAPPDEDEGFAPGPRRGFRRPPIRRAAGAATITLVFGSGTPQEQSVPGRVVADDRDVDLAVLHFQGAHDLPRPLDPRQQPPLVETMAVYLFGFPFGQALALDKGNPAITVGKGSVSSIRRNDRGELAIVQIDGDLNPGNSGGPVVDAHGRLVGVAVAKVRNTQIGLAIPAPQLTRLLAGKVPSFSVQTVKVENGAASLQVVARILDPLGQLRGVSVHYVRGNQANQRGPLQGAQKASLIVRGAQATAQLSLPAQDQGDNTFSFQVSYVTAEGQTAFTAAQVVQVGARVAAQPPANGPTGPPRNALAPPERKPLTREELTQVLNQLAQPEWFNRQQAAGRLAAALPTKEQRAEVVKALEPLLQDKDWGTRLAVVKAYGPWAGKDGVPHLLPLTKDDNGLVIWALFDFLKEFKDERCIDAVAEALVPFDRRGRAVDVLRAIGPKSEKAALKYITHQDWGVRLAVCELLRDIGTKQSVPALEKAVQEGGLVGPAATEALKAIAGRG